MAKTEMAAEYDFSQGVSGKYAKKYQKGTNVVVIEADLFKEFPDSESVNSALRRFMTVKEIANASK